MTTVIVVKCPEGLVLAADSRMNVVERAGPKQKPPWSTDTLLKILSFKQPHNFVGAVSWGRADINRKTVYCYLPEFELSLPDKRIPVKEFSQHLFEFFKTEWNKSPERKYSQDSLDSMNFLLGGFDEKGAHIFEIKISDNPEIVDMQLREENRTEVILRGHFSYASRLWLGYPKDDLPRLLAKEIAPDSTRESAVTDFLKYTMAKVNLKKPLSSHYLKDAVALARLLIQVEIDAQALAEGPDPGSKAEPGGPIRICTITPEHGLTWVL
jgi:hypothetical protein